MVEKTFHQTMLRVAFSTITVRHDWSLFHLAFGNLLGCWLLVLGVSFFDCFGTLSVLLKPIYFNISPFSNSPTHLHAPNPQPTHHTPRYNKHQTPTRLPLLTSFSFSPPSFIIHATTVPFQLTTTVRTETTNRPRILYTDKTITQQYQ